jgi:biotin carboxylase
VRRLLLLIPATSYRTGDFLAAARRLGVEVVVGSDRPSVLEAFSSGRTLALDFAPIEDGISRIIAHARHYPISAILGCDEGTTVLAAAAAKALGLPHNSTESVAAAHDKYLFRRALERAGIPSPWFRLISLRQDLAGAAAAANYPCVLKPRGLSGSRGVIRCDDEASFVAACDRITAILRGTAGLAYDHADAVLAEGFIAGREVALEGLLDGGRLQTLAMFDKPDPLDGPYFEETIYVTPSRLSDSLQAAVVDETAGAAAALGLRDGPIHAELRLNNRGAWLIELAARSIGGLCSRALGFTHGAGLEELILRHALGLPTDRFERETPASGVMMIPIPRAGRLQAVSGLDAARAIPSVDDVVISIRPGEQLVPLPEGDRYLGFIFARADDPAEVEAALRRAHQRIRFDIAPATAPLD